MIGLFKKAIVDFPVRMQARNYRLSSIAAYMILLEQHDKSGVQWSIGIVKFLSFDVAYNKVLIVLITSLVGADIIGVNCRFDHNLSLQTIGLMKEALDKEGLTVHLMMQPVGYLTPDAGPMGLAALPEAPLGKV